MTTKRLQYKGMTFSPRKNGTVAVSAGYGEFQAVCDNFGEATEWIFEMADNNDIGSEFCQRICDAFNCDVYGN